jgi:hypothetical protein
MGSWARFVALAVVAVALGGQAPQQRAQANQNHTAKNQTQAAPAVAPPSAKSVEPIQPSEYYLPCGDSGEDRNSDLCAQWTAAQGAANAAYWAKWSFWVSLFGFIGLLITLYYTRKAVVTASRSTEHAATAAKAAVDQHRAWLKIKDISLSGVKWKKAMNRSGHPEFLSARVTAFVKNVGGTPATKVSYEARIWAFPMLANYSEWHEIWGRAAAAHRERVKNSVEGWVLFPGDSREQRNTTSTRWNAVEGEAHLDSKDPTPIRLMGILSVVYRVASGDIAQTSVPFLFDRIGQANPWTGKSLMEAGEWQDPDVFFARIYDGERAT